jgi:hypothetical protein
LTSRAVELAAKIQQLLQLEGYEVSRHASSMIILYRGRLAATLHVYPEECRLNIYKPWSHLLAGQQQKLEELLARHCPRLEAGYTPTARLAR